MRELSLNVMDVVQNSISAKASEIEIDVFENIDDKTLSISINDNGKGMDEQSVKNVVDPFFTSRTTRKVGLGVPLFKMAAEMTGGSFNISSEVGVGTRLQANFITSHIDMTPLGDINATVLPLVTGNKDIEFLYTYSKIKGGEKKSFSLDTREIKTVLGDGVEIDLPDVVVWLKEYLEENQKEIDT